MRSTFLLLSFAPAIAFAQPHNNDTCADAVPIAVSAGTAPDAWVPFDLAHTPTIGATSTCVANTYRDAWFSFVATGSTHTIVHYRTGSGTSFSIEAYSGTCGSLSPLGCTPAGMWSLTLNSLAPGSTYLFRIWGVTNVAPAYLGAVGVMSALPNDDCVNAVELISANGPSFLTQGLQALTINATQSQPGCVNVAASDDDVWFRFTAQAASHTVLLTSTDDVVVQAFTGSCGALTSVWCDDAWSYAHAITGLTAGQVVYLCVYSESTSAQDWADVRISITGPPANDECADALPISVSDGLENGQTYAFSLGGATSSTVNQYATAMDVWYAFTAPSAGLVFEKQNTYQLSLYEPGCGDALANATGSTALVLTNLVPGTTYLLKAGDSNADQGGFTAHGLTTNDECTDAITLAVQSANAAPDYTRAITHGATETAPACQSGTNDDVWFTFTATAPKVFLSASPGNVDYEYFTGTCGALVSEECSGVTSDGVVLDSLVIGTTYRLRLWTGGASPASVLRVALSETLLNDECTGAIPLVQGALTAYDLDERTDPLLATSSLPVCGFPLQMTSDLWYSFTAVGTTAAMVMQPEATSFTMSGELFSGTCGALTSLLCFDDPQINFTGLVAGNTYYVRVYPQTGSPKTFKHQFYQPPVNDEITGAIRLYPEGNAHAHPMRPFANYGASQSFPQVACSGTPANDVWFWFVATQGQHMVGADVGSLLYPETANTFRIETFRGFSTIPDTLLANELACGQSTSGINVTGLAVGDTVYVRMFSSTINANAIRTIHPWVGDGSDPDNASGATDITTYDAYAMAFDTDNATQSLPANGCFSSTENPDDDIWFRFTHDGQPATITVHFLDNSIVTELFEGPVGSLVPIACGDNMLVLPSTLVDGQSYHFRVFSRNASDANGMIGIFHTPHPMESECADVDCLGPNLVLNPSIEPGELCVACVTITNSGVQGYPLAPNWHTVHLSSDVYASCPAYDQDQHLPYVSGTPSAAAANDPRPRNGTGFAGLYALSGSGDYHEVIGGELAQALVPGTPYLIAFNVKLRPDLNGVDGLGAYLSTEPMADYSEFVPMLLPAQIMWDQGPIVERDGWLTICGQIIADKPYRYINIGKFTPRDGTLAEAPGIGGAHYYFVDDVTVAEVIDALCVTVDVPEEDPTTSTPPIGDGLRVFPNPANDRFNISIEEGMLGEEAVIELFDVTGKQVHARVVPSLASNVVLELPAELREGLYLVMVRMEGRVPMSARVILHR